ncbi:hypothetical protein C3Y87_00415 [Carbonactinospora thermoautotrophica]|nr:hypothetical protein [Carbonactinospora thermoautotrophica]
MIGPRHGDEEAIQRAEQAHYLSRLLGELRASAETLPARVGEEVAVKDHLCGLLVTPGRGEHLPARALDRLTTATGHLAALVSLFTGRRAGPPPTRSTSPARPPGAFPSLLRAGRHPWRRVCVSSHAWDDTHTRRDRSYHTTRWPVPGRRGDSRSPPGISPRVTVEARDPIGIMIG